MCNTCLILNVSGFDAEAVKEEFIKNNAVDIYATYGTALDMILDAPDDALVSDIKIIANAAIEAVVETFTKHASDLVMEKMKDETVKKLQPKHG